jgi:sodium/hydrogen exchanger-like protein 3
MFLGVATVNNHHIWNTWFVLLTVLFCSFFRVIGVIMLVAIANRFRIHKLSKVDQFVMSYGGLRGAVAFALVLLIDPKHVPLQPMFVTTTIAVIYFTVFLQGITIKPLVKILNVKRANKRKPTMNERIHERFIDHMMAGLEDIVGKTGNYNLRDKFKRFDNRFIRPYLIRDLQGAEPKILETYSKLAMKDAIDYMRRNPSTIGQMSGTESMSALFRNYTGVFGGSPSFSNLENSTRNLDMQELDYNPSKKDLTDARIHHLLAEELKPYRRHRRLSYSRHAVDDRDLSTQVNYKMHMNIRRMGGGDRKHHKRSKRQLKEGAKQNQVSFAEFKQNGSAKQFANDYINEVLHENSVEPENGQNEDWDSGLTFTAKSSLDEGGDTFPEDFKRFSRDSEGEVRVATPTATESTLPWKRGDEAADEGALKQNEFPAWASNKEYLAYNSPSATFLGGLSKPKQVKSVIGLFRRESTTSGGASGTDVESPVQLSNVSNPPLGRAQADRRSASITGMPTVYDDIKPGGHHGQFPVTASHRRNTRRGSLLEMSGLIVTGRRPSRRIVPLTGPNSLE